MSAEVGARGRGGVGPQGSICPGPTGDTLAALKTLPAGSKLAVITDFPARQTIPRLVEQRGCSCR